MWVVTRYDDVLAVLRDHARFSSSRLYDEPAGFLGLTAADVAVLEALVPRSTPNLAGTDPPVHDRLRSGLERPFTPSAIGRFEPRVRRIVDDLIDRFAAAGEADLVAQFAAEIPILSILGLIGVPADEIARVRRWYADWMALVLAPVPAVDRPALAASVGELHRYLAALVAARRATPADDLTSVVVREMATRGAELTEAELVNVLSHFLAAGTETTTIAIGTGLYRLLRERRHWQDVVAEPSTIPRVVEESLRFNTSLRGLIRVTTEAVELGGVAIPAAARIYVVTAAANRDPNAFDRPDQLDPKRADVHRHVTFGYGIHHCLGAALARLELRVALEQLRARLPALELDPGRAVEIRESPVARSVVRLFVRWSAPP